MLRTFRSRRVCVALTVCGLILAALFLPGPDVQGSGTQSRRSISRSRRSRGGPQYRQQDAEASQSPALPEEPAAAITQNRPDHPPVTATRTVARNDSVRVAWINRRLWHGTYRADPILNFVEHITGLPATLKRSDGSLHPHDTVDVFLVSQAGSAADLRAVRKAHGSHAIFVYVNSEPQHDGYSFEDLVDVSFGQGPPGPAPRSSNPRCAAALASPTFLRTPFWLLNVFSRADSTGASAPFSCRVMDVVNQTNADPERWAARPRLALHVARHDAFPRKELRALFDSVGKRVQKEAQRKRAAFQKSEKAEWRVDVPGAGKPHYNMPWPKEFSDDVWGKIRLARKYRYNIQPENSRTPCEQGRRRGATGAGAAGAAHTPRPSLRLQVAGS